MRKTLCILTLLGLAAVPVRADDLVPAPWRGLSPTYTFQEWTFDTPANPSPPNIVNNPFGIPASQVTAGSWDPAGWTLSAVGSMAFEIPNSPVANPVKDIWVQITYQQVGPTPLSVSATAGGPVVSGNLEQTLPLLPWTHVTYSMTLSPNPPSETVTIMGEVLIGQVVIETQCVPEPGSLAFMGLGIGIGMLLWRLRK
jgi:hypothetical protein